MEDYLFGIPDMDVYLVIGILLFFILMEVIGGYWQKTQRTASDWIQELGSYLLVGLGTKAAILVSVLGLSQLLVPQFNGLLQGNNLILMTLFYVLIDDFLQYWYHRSAHEYNFLWKLHRPHHQAEEMGFFVSYRNAVLYYVIMPNLWWVGICTFLGLIKAVAIGLVLKQLIIIGSHSTISYDKILYKYKFLNPLATIWERIFITPAFHHAHHGKTKKDGISDPNNNFGNMFSLWDQLFGTAVYTRKFPTNYGLENDPKEHWTAILLYPLVTSKNKKSEISRGHKKESTITMEPATIKLEKGEKYLWCQCGMSKNQPFCDGTHHGTKHKPLLFEAKRTGDVRLCNCKLTKKGPFCDDSHIDVKNN
jgi:sterol desaturase/sphingolipid hydroxylase (fatty acid hydroxylase superfamily)/CDGSH-type Zn-finger protein